MIICVSGTGTGVGKTIATAAITAVARHLGWSVHVVKPVQTGEPVGSGDLATVGKLTGLSGTNLHEYARYPEPLAPLMAAQRSGIAPLELDDVATRITELNNTTGTTATAIDRRLVLVEGAGGVLVELGRGWTLADLAGVLAASVVVTTTTGLGSLNHALLTLEALDRRAVTCVGLIGGARPSYPDVATRLTIREFAQSRGLGPTRVSWLGVIPQGAGELSRPQFIRDAQEWIELPRQLKEGFS